MTRLEAFAVCLGLAGFVGTALFLAYALCVVSSGRDR